MLRLHLICAETMQQDADTALFSPVVSELINVLKNSNETSNKLMAL